MQRPLPLAVATENKIIADLLRTAEQNYTDIFNVENPGCHGAMPAVPALSDVESEKKEVVKSQEREEAERQERKKELENKLKLLVSSVEMVGAFTNEMTPALLMRFARLEIKICTLGLRGQFYRVYSARRSTQAEFRRPEMQTAITNLLKKFVKASDWLICHDDMQSQRDLFSLYELLSARTERI